MQITRVLAYHCVLEVTLINALICNKIMRVSLSRIVGILVHLYLTGRCGRTISQLLVCLYCLAADRLVWRRGPAEVWFEYASPGSGRLRRATPNAMIVGEQILR